MASKELNALIQQADQLPPEDQITLIAHLIERIRQNYAALPQKRYRWSDILGIAPYPLMGEDAQEAISRSRRESDGELAEAGMSGYRQNLEEYEDLLARGEIRW
jgi:hypothetical protein